MAPPRRIVSLDQDGTSLLERDTVWAVSCRRHICQILPRIARWRFRKISRSDGNPLCQESQVRRRMATFLQENHDYDRTAGLDPGDRQLYYCIMPEAPLSDLEHQPGGPKGAGRTECARASRRSKSGRCPRPSDRHPRTCLTLG